MFFKDFIFYLCRLSCKIVLQIISFSFYYLILKFSYLFSIWYQYFYINEKYHIISSYIWKNILTKNNCYINKDIKIV